MSVLRAWRMASVLAALATASCGGPFGYSIALPNGYLLVREHSGSLGVVDPRSRVVVGPSQYGIVVPVVGDLVVGNLDTEEDAFGVPPVPDRYFVVDTKSGAVESELSYDQYRHALVARGIGAPPTLVRPNKMTRFAVADTLGGRR